MACLNIQCTFLPLPILPWKLLLVNKVSYMYLCRNSMTVAVVSISGNVFFFFSFRRCLKAQGRLRFLSGSLSGRCGRSRDAHDIQQWDSLYKNIRKWRKANLLDNTTFWILCNNLISILGFDWSLSHTVCTAPKIKGIPNPKQCNSFPVILQWYQPIKLGSVIMNAFHLLYCKMNKQCVESRSNNQITAQKLCYLLDGVTGHFSLSAQGANGECTNFGVLWYTQIALYGANLGR